MTPSDNRDLDAPSPPGGPLRQDAPQGDETPGQESTDPGPAASRVDTPNPGTGDVADSASVPAEDDPGDEHGEEAAHEDARGFGEPADEHDDDLPSTSQSAADAGRQGENAGTTADQPSS